MLKYHLHMLQYLNHPPTGCNGKFLQLHWSLLRGQLDYGSHSSKLSLMAQHNRLHLDWASVHYSLNNASEPPLQYRFLNLTEYFVVPWPLTLIPNRFPAVRPRNYFILMLESCLSLPSHTTLRAIKTFTGSYSGSKSCGWPAAYTKKYVDFEKFRAFQTFYSFYRDYELLSKVRLGSSVDKGLLSKHFCLESS